MIYLLLKFALVNVFLTPGGTAESCTKKGCGLPPPVPLQEALVCVLHSSLHAVQRQCV